MSNLDQLVKSAFNLNALIDDFTNSLFDRFENPFLDIYCDECEREIRDEQYQLDFELALLNDPDYLKWMDQCCGE